MRPIAFLILLVLFPVSAARAQMAAPGLLPFVNPATLTWEFSPIVIGTLFTTGQTATRGGASATDREGDGTGVLLRGRRPGKPVALGASLLDADLDLGNASVGTTKQRLRTYSLGVAARIGERIALGAGVEGVKESEATAAADLKLGTVTTLFGTSLRLADIIYFATVHGQRRLKSNIPERDGQLRNMTRYGAGLRWFNSTMLVHAEYSHEDSPPLREVTFAALPGFTFDILDTEVDTVIMEVVWQGLFLGFSGSDIETLGIPVRNETIRIRYATVGVMPSSGLIATLTLRTENTEDRIKNTSERLEVRALGIAWRI